jgi:hypothetical protein
MGTKTLRAASFHGAILNTAASVRVDPGIRLTLQMRTST